MRILDKSGVNMVFANDLAKLRKGKPERLVVTNRGVIGTAEGGADGIARVVLYHLDVGDRNRNTDSL